MRLSPLMPNEPLNYACSLTSMTLRDMAISTIGSLPKAAYEVWLASQATMVSAKGASRSWSPVLIFANVAVLFLMIALCVQAYNKYQHYVEHSEARISVVTRRTMMRRTTLRGFNMESRRQRKLLLTKT